jgi:hypothetical protein
MRKLLLVLLAAILSACAAAPTQDELARADYGAYPENFKDIIGQYVSSRLKDPDSAQFRYQNYPKPGYSRLGGMKFGYVVCVAINAKNSFGGYTGYHANYFMIKDGVIIDAMMGSSGDYGDILPATACKKYPVDKL